MTATAERAPGGHSVSLDALRAFPSLIVLISHLVPAVFIKDGTQGQFAVTGAVYGVGKTVNSAVVVLVVLSGYIVGGGVIRAARRAGPWRLDLYTVNRLTRLWNVLIPALILGYVVDRGGIALFGTNGVYGGHTTEIVFYNAELFTTALNFLNNALFLGAIKSPTFGTNGALWTVNFEFWFYFMGAALLYGLFGFRKSTWVRTAMRVVIVLALAAFVRGEVIRYFSFWCLGAAASLVPIARVRVTADAARTAVYALAVAVVIVGLALGGHFAEEGYRIRLVSAVFAAAAIPFLVANERTNPTSRPLARATMWLAGISFSLYATHVPLLIFYRAWLEHHGGAWHLGNASMIAAIIPAAAALLFAWGFAWCTEYRLGDLRSAIRRAGARLGA